MTKYFQKLITLGFCSVLPLSAISSGGGSSVSFGHPTINHSDQASLQRGAKIFMNYCSGCHSLQFMRYERMARDTGMTKNDGSIATEVLKENLMFTSDKTGDHIISSMPTKESAKWFGAPPPDLTLEARARGEDWLYNYLLGFYRDDSRTWGVNNAVFKDVGMPNVLGALQGVQEPIYRTHLVEGEAHKTLVGVKVVETGVLSETEFKALVNDLVNFLSYTGNPVKEQSKRIGLYVLLFLSVLFALSYALKKEYWKDIH